MEILAVYINIYYLYFVFEIAEIWKSGNIYCSKDIKKSVHVDGKMCPVLFE